MKPIYALVIGIPAQQTIIEAHCYGTCGKIIAAAINTDFCGMLAPCRIEAKDCPRFDKEMNEAIGETMGDLVYIRKLK